MKYYFLDPGILRMFLGASLLETDKAKGIENFVCAELIKQLLPHKELKYYKKNHNPKSILLLKI